MTKRAILYARVSTDDQAENGYSLPTQLEAMRQYADENGMKVVRELQDDYSGAKLDRPALDTLRAMLERKEADAVIVYAADRLSRNLAHLLILREEFNRAGIELHYCNRGKSEDTAESRLMENIEGVIAEFEREKIRERMRRGKMGMAKAIADAQKIARETNKDNPHAQKWIGYGRAPYGFRKVGKSKEARLEIDEAQAAIVRRIADMFLGRNGYNQAIGLAAIAGRLTAEGVPTCRKSRGWWTRVIHAILTGKEILGEFTRMGQTLTYPELAIIDRATWDEVQAAIKQNKHLCARNRKYPYLFSGFVKCTCGYRMCGHHSSIKPKYHYYVCPRKWGAKHVLDCEEKSVNAEMLESLVWSWLTEILTDDAKMERGLREMVDNRENELAKLRARRADAAKLIRQKDKQIDQLRADLRGMSSQSGRAAILKDIDLLGNEKDSLLAEQQKIDADLESRAIADADLEKIREFARKIRHKLNGNPTYEEKRALFQMLNLDIQLQHNEDGREIKITCGLPNFEQNLPLPSRKNFVGNELFSRKRFSYLVIFSVILPLPKRINALEQTRRTPTPIYA